MSHAAPPKRPIDYGKWTRQFDTLGRRDERAIRAHIARFSTRPRFHLLLAADRSRPEDVRATLASLREQLYGDFTSDVVDISRAPDNAEPDWLAAGPHVHLVQESGVATWLAAFNASLAGEEAADWVMLMRAGDRMPRHALYWFACAALANPAAVIVYSDDDAIDAQGRRHDPRFKPDWSPSHLRSTHYIGEAAMLRGAAVAAAGGITPECCRHGVYDLLLRVVDTAGGAVAHVPSVLLHRRRVEDAADAPGDTVPRGRAGEQSAWCARALQAHLDRNAVAADLEESLPGCRRIRYRLPAAPPLVSIIVPTRDAPDLLRTCVESLLGKTSYPRFELLVVDNQSADPRALAYLREISGRPAVRVLRYDRPFNYSAINNFAAREAQGEMLCLLNNDTEVISPGWLEEMAGHLAQPRVGAVGAKLLFPDGRVQHAGDAVGPAGKGGADHMHAGIGGDAPGYCSRAAIAQEVSAVTGACLLTWTHLYRRLGGLDETRLSVAYNDVDYCLRLQDAGFRVIYTPYALLYHHQSATRGRDRSLRKWLRARRELKYLRRRWAERLRYDPYYNLNLNYFAPDFTLSSRPRVRKPWTW